MFKKKNENKLPIGIYVHIPFCKHKCSYCDFYSLACQEDKMDAYVDAVIRHMEEIAPQMNSYLADTVYFGGGTPSYLGVERIRRLMKALHKEFHIAKDAEVTMECNPESSQSKDDFLQLSKMGFNRISLGVQSTDDGILKEIGRIHTYQNVKNAIESIKAAGFKNISVDLMYGLPHQSLDQWKETLETLIKEDPQHISCYALKVEEGTPLYEKVKKEEISLPSDDMQADMYLYAVDKLQEAGYLQYEISNFAKEGYESKHNLKYWKIQEYIGFGPGAHSDTGNCRFAYEKDLDGYIEGKLQLSEREEISERERDLEYIMLSMRLSEGIDRYYYEHDLREKFAPLEEVFLTLEKEGYAERTEKGWKLTPRGMFVSNSIILLLEETAGKEKSRRLQERAKGNYRIET